MRGMHATVRRWIGILRAVAVTGAAALAAGALAAPAAAQAPEGFTMTGFDPQRHAFRFVNSWSTGSLTATLPLVGQVNFGSVGYGLCGGMSFAALDSFHADRSAPATTSVPGPGSALRTYIWDRQIASLTMNGAAALARFLDWQLKPQEDQYLFGVRTQKGLTTLTNEEVHFEILPRLRRGEPVPLGIVNVSGFAAPWGNHQVLAIGFRMRDAVNASIAVYDPNHPVSRSNPDGITFLHTSNRRQTLDPSPSSTRARSGQFRALFRAPYAKRTPPAPPFQRS